MELNRLLEFPLMGYATARSLHYSLQYGLLNTVSRKIPGLQPPRFIEDLIANDKIREGATQVLREDVQNIVDGLYPVTVLQPESPITHAKRLTSIFLDGIKIYRRRKTCETKAFSKEASQYIDDVPDYYKRNFHFQTDGYLSAQSAELYDHQVELLFGGTADAMRRLMIKPLKEHYKNNPTGKGLTFLEIGAGTGRATMSVKLAFPDAKIVVTDLSEPYLKVARERLKRFKRLDYVQADGSNLPFANEKFDAVYNVFTLHEIPLEERKKLLKESARVLKKGGLNLTVDTAQLGDVPELDEVFRNFPVNFHEPFYLNYIKSPMEKAYKALRLKNVRSHIGFFSKVTSAEK